MFLSSSIVAVSRGGDGSFVRLLLLLLCCCAASARQHPCCFLTLQQHKTLAAATVPPVTSNPVVYLHECPSRNPGTKWPFFFERRGSMVLFAKNSEGNNLESLENSFNMKVNGIKGQIQRLEKELKRLGDKIDKQPTYVLTSGSGSQEETSSSLKEIINKLDTSNQLLKQLEARNAASAKMHTLAWAIENAERNSFDYYIYELDTYYGRFHCDSQTSKDLIQEILFAFRQGLGYYLPDDASLIENRHRAGTDIDESEKKDFRSRVSEQIHELTGIKPRIEFKKKKGRYLIYDGGS